MEGLPSGQRWPVRVVEWNEAQERAANITANNPYIGGEFTQELQPLLRELEGELGLERLGELRLDTLLDDDGSQDEDSEDGTYTNKIDGPVYEPTGDRPEIGSLLDTTKTNDLLAEIDSSDIPAEVAGFLRAAAHRHTVFDYRSIAEYYAHADKKTQELMERSALVIIDFGKAIDNGFVRLTEALAQSYRENQGLRDE